MLLKNIKKERVEFRLEVFILRALLIMPLMSKIESKYCVISTLFLAGVFDIISYYFICEGI